MKNGSSISSSRKCRVVLVVLLVGLASQAFAQRSAANVSPSQPDPPNAPSDQAPLPDSPSTAKLVYAPPKTMTVDDRMQRYSKENFRPAAVLGIALTGLSQWEAEPRQWKGGPGYGQSIAASISRQAVSESIRVGVAAIDGEDPRYHRSRDTSVLGRARHAFVGTFTSETGDGSLMPAYSRFAGAYGAAFISNSYSYYADPRANAAWAMRRGSTALASTVGLHLLQEFAPRNKYTKMLGLFNDPR